MQQPDPGQTLPPIKSLGLQHQHHPMRRDDGRAPPVVPHDPHSYAYFYPYYPAPPEPVPPSPYLPQHHPYPHPHAPPPPPPPSAHPQPQHYPTYSPPRRPPPAVYHAPDQHMYAPPPEQHQHYDPWSHTPPAEHYPPPAPLPTHQQPPPPHQQPPPPLPQPPPPHPISPQAMAPVSPQNMAPPPAAVPRPPPPTAIPSDHTLSHAHPEVPTVAAPEPDKAAQAMVKTVIEHSNAIYHFASLYASLSTTHPNATPVAGRKHPTPSEIQDMTKRARLVLELVERMRRIRPPSDQQHPSELANGMPGRKRTWDQIEPNAEPYPAPVPPAEVVPEQPATHVYDDIEFKDPEARSLAERDMMTIRSKRSAAAAVAAANANAHPTSPTGEGANGATGTHKSAAKKSRKRGRTPLPGKCHSCNIRETPEWRRGPDGARTLCNACGLHYAKLVRKRDKALSNSGAPANEDAMPIDMEMVRASSQRGGAGQLSAYENGNGNNSSNTTSGASSTPVQTAMRQPMPPPPNPMTQNKQQEYYSSKPPAHLPPMPPEVHHDPYRTPHPAYSHSPYSPMQQNAALQSWNVSGGGEKYAEVGPVYERRCTP